MSSTISYNGPNSGFQVGQNYGSISVQFSQSDALNLECLRDLRATNPHDDRDRIKSMNGGLLKDSYHWILDNEVFGQWQYSQSSRLLWIRGGPGKGKTMLLCGIIEELTRSVGTNLSFFFCQAADVRLDNATAVLRGLIYSLVVKQPSLLCYVRSQWDQAGKALFEDANAWNALSRILTDILKDRTLQRTYLVIDALDECTKNLSFLLNFIIQESAVHPQVKWIVSSRNWPQIEERLETMIHIVSISLDENEVSVSESVNKFIHYKVHRLAKAKKYKDETRDMICSHLLSNSQGTFLWVALVCQDLERTSRWNALKKLEAFPPGLNSLYSRMADQVRKSEDADICKRILAAMSIVYRPITLKELAYIIEMPNNICDDYEALAEVIAICGSFLTLYKGTITFVHQSAKEFLYREIPNELFPRGIKAEHRAIFSRSLQMMFKILRRDILQIDISRFPITEGRHPTPNPLVAAQYTCVYWVDHLQDSVSGKSDSLSLDEKGCVGSFLQQKYLYWLEALGVLGRLSQGIAAMLKLEGVLQNERKPQELLYQVRDAYRFIRYHRLAIENSPLQIYSSPLIFSPTRSITAACYQKERPAWVLNKPVVEEDWSPCLQTLEGHTQQVSSIAWSQDGARLASGSYDKTIRIWDPATGQCESTLEGHSGAITSIAWSQGGNRLVSGSYDKTVRIWNLTSGQCVSTLWGHTQQIVLIVWSQDRSRLVSASLDSTVRIWDTAIGQCESILEGLNDFTNAISWSQDRKRLASASNETIRIWDSGTGQCESMLEGHSDLVTSTAWSQDGSRLASGSYDRTVWIWDSTTGKRVTILRGHGDWVNLITWSQNGGQLASASDDKTIRIWDPTTGQCVSTLNGHSGPVKSIIWSQDGRHLASASSDKTVRIWDPAIYQGPSTLDGHSDLIKAISWSQDGSRLVSVSIDKTVRIWNPATGQCESTLDGHSGSVSLIAWSEDGSRLALASDKVVSIWNPATGQCESVIKGHTDWVNWITWSQYGGRLATASDDRTAKIWDPITGQCISTLEGHSDLVKMVTWSRDGGQIASGSFDKTVRIWNTATGLCVSTLAGHSDLVRTIAWSQDGSRLASGSSDKAIWIWDAATSQHKLILEGHNRAVTLIAWSQNGSWLASASLDNTVRIWDATTGQCVSALSISFPGFLQFDKIILHHLHTSVGTFDIGLTGSVMSSLHSSPPFPKQYGYGLNDDHSWITYDGVNLLWLPTEYRPVSPSLYAISRTTVAICCSSDRVIFLTLSEKIPSLGVGHSGLLINDIVSHQP